MTDHLPPDYTPIDCNLYDYVEIACLYRYPVRIATTTGDIVTGTAATTTIDRDENGDKVEYLELDVDGSPARIRLDSLSVLEPLVEDARFGKVRFRE